jgi:hypothetical protein
MILEEVIYNIIILDKTNNSNNSNGDLEFRRKKENNESINIEDEIQKIIADSLVKAKTSTKANTIINPLNDIKKKDLNKMKENTSKMKLITKQSNKINVKEIDKNIFNN